MPEGSPAEAGEAERREEPPSSSHIHLEKPTQRLRQVVLAHRSIRCRAAICWPPSCLHRKRANGPWEARPRFAAWALVLADSCMYEHALLHSGHASAGPMHRKPASGRHTLAFVAGCELLVLLRASSGSNPPPANGVTGSPSAGGLSRCSRWSSDGLLWGQNSMSLEGSWASRGLSDVKSEKQVVHDFMPDTLAGVHSACGACLSTQCCWCCDRRLALFFSFFCPLMHWAAISFLYYRHKQAWEKIPLHNPGFEVACSH